MSQTVEARLVRNILLYNACTEAEFASICHLTSAFEHTHVRSQFKADYKSFKMAYQVSSIIYPAYPPVAPPVYTPIPPPVYTPIPPPDNTTMPSTTTTYVTSALTLTSYVTAYQSSYPTKKCDHDIIGVIQKLPQCVVSRLSSPSVEISI